MTVLVQVYHSYYVFVLFLYYLGVIFAGRTFQAPLEALSSSPDAESMALGHKAQIIGLLAEWLEVLLGRLVLPLQLAI